MGDLWNRRGEILSRRMVVKSAVTAMAGAAACSRGRQGLKQQAATTAPAIWKAQSDHPSLSADYEPFVRFCNNVTELSEGQLVLEPHGPGEVVPVKDMMEATRTGALEVSVTFPGYADKIPGASFLTSYPLGLDRPDQWETWYYRLGGLELARRMFAPFGLYFLGPVQHDLNLIHSRVPIRSLDDFKGLKIRMPGGLIAEVFDAAGAHTVLLTGDQVYPTLQSGALDAADFAGPATNFALGFANVAKYIVMGPVSTPCIHQPVDLHCALVSMDKFRALPRHLQDVLEYACRRFSWDDYVYVQQQNIVAWERYREKGVEILRLSTADVDRLRKLAIPLWFKWAKRDALAREAFASQLDYMKNPSVGYLTDADLVDANGARLFL